MLRILLLLACAPAGAQTAPVAQAVQTEVDARYPEWAGRLIVRAERVPEAAAALEAPRVAWADRGRVPRGPLSVEVTDARGQSAGRARVFVAHFDSVFSTTETLRKGDAAGDALTVVWTETTRLSGDPLTPRDLPPGEVFATRYLRADRVLRRGDVRGAFAAEVGEVVAMRYRRGAIGLELRATARQAGHVGDAVRLHAPDTGTTYRARLVAPGVAEWIETL